MKHKFKHVLVSLYKLNTNQITWSFFCYSILFPTPPFSVATSKTQFHSLVLTDNWFCTWSDDLFITQQPQVFPKHRDMFHQCITSPRWTYWWIPKRRTSSDTQQNKNDSQINIVFHEKPARDITTWKYQKSYQACWPKGFPH